MGYNFLQKFTPNGNILVFTRKIKIIIRYETMCFLKNISWTSDILVICTKNNETGLPVISDVVNIPAQTCLFFINALDTFFYLLVFAKLYA